MPFPFIAVAIAAAVFGGGGGAAIYVFWEDVKAFFSKRTLVILGQRRTGKTTLITRLVEKKILDQYTATGAPVPRAGVRIETVDQKVVRTKQIADVGGGADDRDVVWREQYERAAQAGSAGLVIYVVNLKHVIEGQQGHIDRACSDAERIGTWQTEAGKMNAPHIILVGSHADQLPGWPDPSAEQLDAFRRTTVYDGFHGLKGFRGAVIGQLNEEGGIESVLREVLRHMKDL
ncbi:MAG: GTPase domain-containing protein [Deltaproteobacteria bacterium]|nr:GTPase domain-containing protein [Myxococcales bacterium]MDP3220373.1 GTPase domain-containing protein [Deltaproteobacteria bacterium]